jgi:hypothetical protein
MIRVAGSTDKRMSGPRRRRLSVFVDQLQVQADPGRTRRNLHDGAILLGV